MARQPKHKTMFGNLRSQDIRALGIGLELSVVIGGMAWGGHWLDERWGTDPWMLLAGVCIGTFGGGWHAMKMANGGKLPDLGFRPKPSQDQPPAPGEDAPGGSKKPKP